MFYVNRTWYNFPHTKTMYFKKDQLKILRAWCDEILPGNSHVSVRKTKSSIATGYYSTVVYLNTRDESIWTQFKLTWAGNRSV